MMKYPLIVILLAMLPGISPALGYSEPEVVRSGMNGAVPIATLAFLGFILPRLIKRDQTDMEN